MGLPKRWLAAGAVGVVVLSGCADQPASAAGVVGGQRVEMAAVTDQVRAIQDILGVTPDTPDAQLTNAVIRNNIVYSLVEQAAAEAGVAVTQTAVDERVSSQIEFLGSESLLNQQAAQAGVAPDLIATDVRVSLLANALAEDLAGGRELGDADLQELLLTEIQAFSDEIGTTVNPRFGVWDVQTLSVVGDPDAPSRPADLAILGTP